jgi:uncharacterized protein YlzI (FlbEa/FlbD family)
MNFITLTSLDGNPLILNINHIGHIYDNGESAKVGVTTHNNGGFSVLESTKEILLMLEGWRKS